MATCMPGGTGMAWPEPESAAKRMVEDVKGRVRRWKMEVMMSMVLGKAIKGIAIARMTIRLREESFRVAVEWSSTAVTKGVYVVESSME